MRLLLGLSCAAVLGVTPRPAVAEDDEDETPEHAFDQARHYHRRGLLKQAQKAIARALATEEGRESARVQLLAAEIYRDRGNIDLCLRCLAKARQHGNAHERETADRLYTGIQKVFGEVRVLTEGGVHVKGRIFLESSEPLIQVQRKNLFKGVQRSLLLTTKRYPDSIWLPYGSYRANGVAFEHRAGGRTEVSVPFPRIAVVYDEGDATGREAARALQSRIGGVPKLQAVAADAERRAGAGERLRAWKPQLVVALGPHALGLARRFLRRVPLLLGNLQDTRSLSEWQAKGEASGLLATPSPGALLERLRKLRPALRRVALICGPGACPTDRPELRHALERLGMQAKVHALPEGGELPASFSSVAEGVEALWALPGPALQREEVFQVLKRKSLSEGIPLLACDPTWVARGALLGAEPSPRGLGIQLANFARRVLYAGKSLRELEPESPERLRWHLNTAAAARLGLELPPALLEEFDQRHSSMAAGESH